MFRSKESPQPIPNWRLHAAERRGLAAVGALAVLSLTVPVRAMGEPPQPVPTTSQTAPAATSPAAATGQTNPAAVPPSALGSSADAQALTPAQTPLVPGSDPGSSAPGGGMKTYTVPAGTKVLLTLQASVNTKSAKPGDGLYLQSAFPVIVGNSVLIPAGMYVQGVVDSVERPIRMKGHTQMKIHFTSMIFPNGSVVEIPGELNSIPGSTGPRVKTGGEGTVEQTGNAGDVAKSAGKGAIYGASGGVLVGSAEGSALKGLGYGGIAGALAGAAVSLFTHGKEIDIPAGSQVEMVLQRPLILQASNLSDPNAPATQPALVPAPQRQAMPKPVAHRILCPMGSSCQ
jgi:hypothetical protein